MKRQPLGRISLLLLLPLLLFGSVKVNVDKNALYRGDSVTYTISVTGSDIEFPTITEIAGSPIEGTSSSQNISMINGDFTKTIAKSFTFTPKSSLEIPAYKVLVNGGVEMTQPVAIKIVEPSQDKTAPIVLDIKLSKEKVHVGEVVQFDLVFKKKPNVPVYKLDIEEPEFEDSWVKKLDGVTEGVDGEYTTQTYSYLLFAQKSGILSIPAITANIGQVSRQNRQGMDPFFNSAFGQQVRYTKVFSNAVSLEAEPLPNGLELYGDFRLKTSVDKKSVLANKPVNLTVKVEGIGNIDDVQKFDLAVAGTVVYANEPVIHTGIENGQYGGTFEQKIVMIAENSYTIPPFELRYFDKKTQKEVRLKSEPIEVHVNGGSPAVNTSSSTPKSKIELSQTIKDQPKSKGTASAPKHNWYELLYAALVGFAIGALFVWLLIRSRQESSHKKAAVTPMEKQIKKANSDKSLFELLLPYKKESSVVEHALMQLEENLYRGASHQVDKKILIDYFNSDIEVVELI